MLLGYARTSTTDQMAGFEAQKRDLKAAGCQEIIAEQVSAVVERAGLNQALQQLQPGDTLVVTKLDRLARSIPHLLEVLATLEAKQAHLVIISWGGGTVDTRSAIGRLFIMMSGAFAAFERDIMLERQKDGIARARAEGKYKGRDPSAMRQADTIKAMHQAGQGPSAIARELRIGRRSVYRALEAP